MLTRIMFPALAIAALAVPLGSASAQDSSSDDSTPAAESTTIYVDNSNYLDMRIYAVSAGRRQQLGTVTGFTRAVFKLPDHLLQPNAPLRLVALPVGSGRTYTSQPVLVDPGDLVEWQLRNNLSLSNISVWKS